MKKMIKIFTNALAYHFYSCLCAKVDTVFARARTHILPDTSEIRKVAKIRVAIWPFKRQKFGLY